jgi:hypothetical protein
MAKPKAAVEMVVTAMENTPMGLLVLIADGTMHLRVPDKEKVNQPGGPFWVWQKVEGPKG